MTSQSSGGSGSGLPGVTGDGLTPGGLHIAGEETVTGAITGSSLTAGAVTSTGALTAGDPTAASVPSFLNLRGNVIIRDSPGNVVDGDDVVDIALGQALGGDAASIALTVSRNSDLNGHDFSYEAVSIRDNTDSVTPIAVFYKQGTSQFQVDGDGVRVHGKFKTGASVAHVLGAFSGNAVPIYDEAGTLLGYMPLYA